MSGPVKFDPGARVYDSDGLLYVYVGPIGDRHVVRAVFDDPDGDEHEGDEQIAHRVFAAPPVQRRNEEIARLDALIAERQEQLSHFDAQAREMRRTLDRNPSIAALVDLLAQKPVFGVDTDTGEIFEMDDVRKFREFGAEMALRSGRMHFWVRFEGREGSSKHVSLYQTREGAISGVCRVVAEALRREDRWGYYVAVNASRRVGLPVPAGAEAKLSAFEMADVEAAIARAEKMLAEAKAARAKLAEQPAASAEVAS